MRREAETGRTDRGANGNYRISSVDSIWDPKRPVTLNLCRIARQHQDDEALEKQGLRMQYDDNESCWRNVMVVRFVDKDRRTPRPRCATCCLFLIRTCPPLPTGRHLCLDRVCPSQGPAQCTRCQQVLDRVLPLTAGALLRPSPCWSA